MRPCAVLLACAALLVGCGGGEPTPRPPAATVPVPALATAPARPGEIVVRAQASPVTRGPVTLDGRYRARFVQYDPTDPRVDFAAQTSFVATLRPARGRPIRLFRTAARTGATTVSARGRYVVDVTFGDFPFALRLTPVR